MSASAPGIPHRSTKIRIAFAANGSKAVVMRHGPGKWTRMLLWDTRTDKLLPGQWIRSKIPNFAINSDGSLVLAFVQSYRARHKYGTWVALSRPPWFTALAIWTIGDSWGGQCAFVTDRKIYIGGGIREPVLEGKLGKGYSWSSEKPPPDDAGWSAQGGPVARVFEKRSRVSGLKILAEKRRSGFEVRIAPVGKDSPSIVLEDVEHVDFDPRGRVVTTTRDGRISRTVLKGRALETKTIFDLSTMEPEPIVAPPEATKW